MKRKCWILLLIMLIIPFSVKASGGFSLSSSSISMYPGETKSFKIISNNAVGKLNITSSNTGVATVNSSNTFIETPGASKTINVTAGSVGTAVISVVATSDFATMDEEILTGVTRTITIKVINKSSNNSNNNNNNNNNSNTVVKDTRSSNNKIKELKIDGYELTKVNDNNYTLTVSNGITSVKVEATAEDSKAKVTGTGSHELKVGDNNIEVVVTAENGTTNKVTIKVTRKDGYYLEDLEESLSDSDDVNIIITDTDELNKEDIEKIKNSKKTINFNYYDSNKSLKYSWIINGNNIEDIEKIDFNISNNSNNSDKILELSNYADGMIINFKHEGKVPDNTLIKYLVGDKYNDGDILKLYYFDDENNNFKTINTNLVVKNGYVEFELDHASEYFITMSNIITETTNYNVLNIIIGIVLFISIVLNIIFVINKKLKQKEKNNNKVDDNILTDTKDDVEVKILDNDVNSSNNNTSEDVNTLDNSNNNIFDSNLNNFNNSNSTSEDVSTLDNSNNNFSNNNSDNINNKDNFIS